MSPTGKGGPTPKASPRSRSRLPVQGPPVAFLESGQGGIQTESFLSPKNTAHSTRDVAIPGYRKVTTSEEASKDDTRPAPGTLTPHCSWSTPGLCLSCAVFPPSLRPPSNIEGSLLEEEVIQQKLERAKEANDR